MSYLQICHEFERFSVYLPSVKVGNFFGGLPVQQQRALLKDNTPHIVVGTPGRLKQVSMASSSFQISNLIPVDRHLLCKVVWLT